MREITAALEKLLNAVDAGQTVFAFAVPSRMFRVTRNESWCSFRVEQFTQYSRDPITPTGAWHLLSTHGGARPGEMLQAAMAALFKAQTDLRVKLQSRIDSRGIAA